MKRKNKRLFISRSAGPLLQNWCTAHGIELIDCSLIGFQPLKARPKHTPDVIFYGSPRSVNFSSEIRQLFPHALSAAVGEATAVSLREIGIAPGFTGKNASNPADVAGEFTAWLGERTVLFPVSVQSVGTVSSAVPEGQKEVVYVYETIASSRIIPPCDYYVFSSPSNWKSFLVENMPSGVILGWGKTTASEIIKTTGIHPITLTEPSENQLISELNKLVE